MEPSAHGGVLFKGDLKIHYGSRHFAQQQAPSLIRVDLSLMAHGDPALDIEPLTVPRFLAAADRMASVLANSDNHSVVVHCGHGSSRTSFTLMVYLIRHQHFSWKDASRLVCDAQEERSAMNRKFSFKINTTGINGGYADWVRRYSEGQTDMVNNDLMDGLTRYKSGAKIPVYEMVAATSKDVPSDSSSGPRTRSKRAREEQAPAPTATVPMAVPFLPVAIPARVGGPTPVAVAPVAPPLDEDAPAAKRPRDARYEARVAEEKKRRESPWLFLLQCDFPYGTLRNGDPFRSLP